ncbi:MAG: extracellular solute-binding protein [Bacillota bacterium]
MKRRLMFVSAVLLLVAMALAGCSSSNAPKDSGDKKDSTQLVIYSGRKEPLIKPVIESFEKETGIKVTLRSGGASELANAIIEEQKSPGADVFIANDAGTLEMLRQKGLLQPNPSAALKAIPDDLKAKDGSWIGVSARSRVIMYNTQLVKETELPKSIKDLTDPKWKKQVAMAASSNESVIGHITSIRMSMGEAETEKLIKDLMANQVQSLKGHTEVRKAVGSGEFKLGLVNHYYYHLQKKEGSPVGVIYPDQGEGQMGVPVNVAGAAIVKGAKNSEAARKFIDYLVKPEAQELFAKLNFEIPVVEGVPANEAKKLSEFKRTPVKLEQLGSELNNTINLIEKAGLP